MPSNSEDAGSGGVERSASMEATLPSAGERSSSPHGEASEARVGVGDKVGRYVVLAELGAGSMGVVFAAYDPELDRKVALKLLRRRGRDRDEARARLQREAQALARLNHPNVVGVHDVGLHEGHVFVAMEHVDGRTLSRWREESSPSPATVLDVFDQAGRGLAAAHAEGLVHRDFKPENVMVDTKGRVRVMDFGLARADSELTPSVEQDEAENLTTSEALVTPLTQTGSLLGTPAYMAAELFVGSSPDARTDQFSFCVALYEALYGERPFAGETIAALTLAITTGRVRDAPKGASVPAWIRAIVVRGLRAKPDRRWGSMEELLEQLRRDPAAKRRRVLGLGVAGALVAGLVWATAQASASGSAVCGDMDAHLAGVWDEAARAQVHAAIVHTELGSAEDVARRTTVRLDAYAEAWMITRADACEATRVRGEQSEKLMDLRMSCLDGRLREFAALTEVLASGDEGTFENAISAVNELPGLARCSDAGALQAAVPPPENAAEREGLEEVRVKLAEAAALRRAGRPHDAAKRARRGLEMAESLGVPEGLARAHLELGRTSRDVGEYEEAEAQLRTAYFASVEIGLTDAAADAGTLLAMLYAADEKELAAGRSWAEHGRAQAQHGRDPMRIAAARRALGSIDAAEDEFESAVANHEAALELEVATVGEEDDRLIPTLEALSAAHSLAGKFDEARKFQQRALDIARATMGPEHPFTASAQAGLGNVMNNQGEYEAAREELQAAAAILERTYGPKHAKLPGTLAPLAQACLRIQDMECARSSFVRALEITRETLGEEHPDVASRLIGVSGMHRVSNETKEAIAALEEALPIMEKAYGPNHHNLARVLTNLGVLHNDMKETEKARQYLDRALPIVESALGPEHPNVALVLGNVAMVDLEEEKFDSAIERYSRALQIREAALGPEHPLLAYTLNGLGRALVSAERPAEAIPHLERAAELRRDGRADHRGNTGFLLARAVWNAPKGKGRDRKRALALAREARKAYLSNEDDDESVAVAKIDDWLAKRGG